MALVKFRSSSIAKIPESLYSELSAKVYKVHNLTPAKQPIRCSWCGKDLASTGRGRPKKYCSQACRQRAYEQRNNVSGTSIPADAVILTPERAEQLQDSLFELRCAAEDIATAVSENEDREAVATLCHELVTLAQRIEKLRS